MATLEPAHYAPTAVLLEASMQEVEERLAALGRVLHSPDADEVDRHANALQTAMAAAFTYFNHAAHNGGVPRHLRLRLMHAGGLLAAHREALARSSAAVDRALDVLLPPPAATQVQPVYGQNGQRAGQRMATGQGLLA